MSAVPPPLPVPAAAAAAAYVLGSDVACVQCGYNLRGLRTDGRCPECNAPVAPALQSNLLRFSHPDWIGKLQLAVRLMLWEIVVVIAVLILSKHLPQPLGSLLNLVTRALSLLASWLVTTPEPQAREGENNLTLRKAVRICAVISAVGSTATTLGRLNGVPYMAIAGSIMAVFSVASTWLFYLYMRRLALRIPDAKLARSTRAVMWGLTVSVGIGAVLDVFRLFGVMMPVARARAGPRAILLFIFLVPAGLGLMVFGIWWLVLLFRYRKEFATAHREAAGNWQRAMAGGADAAPAAVAARGLVAALQTRAMAEGPADSGEEGHSRQ